MTRGRQRVSAGPHPSTSVDERALARVRALLAKAEATDFPEEAEALSAKAQELMAKYAIERLVGEGAPPSPRIVSREVWLDPPYAAAKSLVVSVVAKANGARAVWAAHLGVVTLVGEDADLAGVELLSTSLLVQAGRAMLERGPHLDAGGASRTRSFRQAFLAAFATRIGERLQEAARVGMAEAAESSGYAEGLASPSLLPVLAAREARVEAVYAEMFPHAVRRSVSVSNRSGWIEGRSAADLAVLGLRRQVAAVVDT